MYSESDIVKKSSSFHCRVSKVGLFTGSYKATSSILSSPLTATVLGQLEYFLSNLTIAVHMQYLVTLCQHSSMMSYKEGGQPCGEAILYPCSTWCSTSAFVMPG